METALKIRQQAEEQRESMKELMNWQESLDTSSKSNHKKSVKNPTGIEKNRETKQKIKSFEYDKWDRFDVEAELEQVDYEPEAKTSLESKIKTNISPEEALFEKEKGNAYFKKQKYRKAIQCYSKSIEYDSSVAIPFVNRCLAYIKIEKYNEAIIDASKAIAIDSKNIKAFWRRGIAKREIKQYLEAKKDFESALILEPSNISIQKDMKELQSLLKNEQTPSFGTQALKRKKIPIIDINRFSIPSAAEKNIAPLVKSSSPALSLDQTEYKSKNDVKPKVPEKLEEKIAFISSDDTKKNPSPSKNYDMPKKSGLVKIETLYDFEREWKSLKNEPEKQFHFLMKFDTETLLKIFKSSFDVTYLKDIINILRNFYLEKEMFSQIVDILSCVAKLPRFKMVLLLLPGASKTNLKMILKTLEEKKLIDAAFNKKF